MSVFKLLLFYLMALTLANGQTTAANEPEPRPNILLIVSDDQRPDTIAALGNPIIKTPALDELVRRGTAFTRATCANPICTPSRAEILTGCTGMRNGVLNFGKTIHPRLVTLPEPFVQAGYATWYCGKWHNNGRPMDHGYKRTRRLFTGGGGKWAVDRVDYRGTPITGYKGWIFRGQDDKVQPELGIGLSPQISEQIADGAIAAINSIDDRPFFVHVNFTAPHDPLLPHPDFAKLYSPSEMLLPKNYASDHPFDHGNRGGRDEVLLPIPRTEADVRADLAAYYAVISHMDAQVGRILQAVKASDQSDNTLIVFTSDHGLAIGSHGLRGKQNMYEHTLGVPMIFVGPGVPVGQQVDGQAYLRDLLPTLCDLAGISPKTFGREPIDGQSQVPVIQGKRDSIYDYVYGYFRDSQRSIRGKTWKLIDYPLANRQQLFNLENDPFELTNLIDNVAYAETKKRLTSKLQRWLESNTESIQTR